jgi:ubiquinone biosynthesis protein UbiJ
VKLLPLALVNQVLNGHIRESTAAMERLAALAGKSLAIDVVGPGITLLLTAQEDELCLVTAAEVPATATVSGTPLALLASLRGDALTGFHASGISLAGEAEVAEEFSELLRLARPDLEEQLAYLTGDLAAHQAGNFVRDVRAWGAQALGASRMNLSEFLQEEGRQLPANAEVEGFYAEVDDLRDATDRLAAKVERRLAAANERQR